MLDLIETSQSFLTSELSDGQEMDGWNVRPRPDESGENNVSESEDSSMILIEKDGETIQDSVM